MAWCWSTRPSVATVLSMHCTPCISNCLWLVILSRIWQKRQCNFSSFVFCFQVYDKMFECNEILWDLSKLLDNPMEFERSQWISYEGNRLHALVPSSPPVIFEQQSFPWWSCWSALKLACVTDWQSSWPAAQRLMAWHTEGRHCV